ncbi:MAG: hypothetical protein WAQ28_19330 [Bacteroidia bacterium]
MSFFEGLTAHCKEATMLTVKKEETKLPFFSQLKLWMHLAYCASCRKFVKQSNQISAYASAYKRNITQSTDSVLTEDQKTRLQNAINNQL